MADINLRSYIQQIDDLVEEGQQLEEAIAHCRHILKSYPKHIDTYRLLGKAYLESKRYGDAGDIFQRVLSAIPDDFVSHVGMAIIREDEGNLDASIWHMERASESKPGNPAIEEELKRLVGKRDGIEPQRVRPTRGALARMYYHGELFSYATSELSTALEEDPDRPDLQLLLADAYWRTDHKIEAADFCGQILEKLPYCTGANKIKAYLLQTSGRPEEAAVNLRRLIALDPYMAFIDNPMESTASIDASAVQLERLVWAPGQPLPSSESIQPDWAASLGVDFRSDEAKAAKAKEVPSWLQSPTSPERARTPQIMAEESSPIHPFAGAKPPPGTDIPEWMRDAGWGEDTGEATESPADILQEPEIEDVGASEDRPLERAELPSWLSEVTAQRSAEQAAASDELPQEIQVPAQPTIPDMDKDQVLDDWMEEISPEEVEEFPGPVSIPRDEEAGIEFEPVLSETLENGVAEIPGLTGLESFLSEDVDINEGIPEYPPWLEPSTPGATDTIVSWLGDKSLKEVSATSDDVPRWMKGTGPLDESLIEDVAEAEADLPSELFAEVPPPYEEITEFPEGTGDLELKVESVITPKEAAPEWLDEIDGLDEEPPPKAVETDGAPEWLMEPSLEVEPASMVEEPKEEPDWLDDLEVVDLSKEEIEFEAKPDAPDWLSEVIREDILVEEDGEPGDVKPDWLEGFVEAEMAVSEEFPAETDEHPEWLSEMSLIEEVDTSPTTQEDEPPEWLKGLADTEIAQVDEESLKEDKPPDWVSGVSFPEDDAEIIPKEETPQWLQELSEASLEVEDSFETASEPTGFDQPEVTEEAPDWLQEFSEFPSEEQAIPEEVSEEIAEPISQVGAIQETDVPEWLQDLESIPTEITPEGLAEVAPEPRPISEALPMEEAPDWLQDFGEAPTELKAISEEVPEGVQELIPVDEILPVEDAPDWLQEFTEIPAGTPSDIREITPELTEEEPLDIGVSAEWVDEVDRVEAPSTADEIVLEEEVPDWLQEIPMDETVEVEPLPAEATDWIQEIEKSEIEHPTMLEEDIESIEKPVAEVEEPEAYIEKEPGWQPEFTAEDLISHAVQEPSESIEVEGPQANLEDSFDWLQETAREVSSEPRLEIQPIEPIYTDDKTEELTIGIEEPLDDEEVDSFLESLAAREELQKIDIPSEIIDIVEPLLVEESIEGKLIEEHIIPEELDESLVWLEQLAGEEPVDDFTPPIFVEESEDEMVSEVPDWLEEVAEKPEDILGETIEIEEVKGAKEVPIEPTIPKTDISSMETIISRRPPAELFTDEDLPEDLIEEEQEQQIGYLDAEVTDEVSWEILSMEEPSPVSDISAAISQDVEISESEFKFETPSVEIEPELVEEGKIKEPAADIEEILPSVVDEPSSVPKASPLETARTAFERGDVAGALGQYSELIEENEEINAVIEDLRKAIGRTPKEPMLWQTLGDALMKVGQLSDAIDAYRRGMEAV